MHFSNSDPRSPGMLRWVVSGHVEFVYGLKADPTSGEFTPRRLEEEVEDHCSYCTKTKKRKKHVPKENWGAGELGWEGIESMV